MSPLLLLHFVTLIVVLLNKPFKTSFLYLLCREKQNIDLFIVQFVISFSIFCNIMPKTIILANLTQKIGVQKNKKGARKMKYNTIESVVM